MTRILDMVKSDLDARDKKGVETYGSSLRVNSKNDALQFAYEEALDLCMYLRQEIARRETRPGVPSAWRGYWLCRGCESALPSEMETAGFCEGCLSR